MTDLDKIKKLIFAFPISRFVKGMIEKLLTHENIRKAYEAVGGEEGTKETFEAFIRIGKGETLGEP